MLKKEIKRWSIFIQKSLFERKGAASNCKLETAPFNLPLDLLPILCGGLLGFVGTGGIEDGVFEIVGQILLTDIMVGIIVWIEIPTEERALQMERNVDAFSCLDRFGGGKDRIVRGIGFW